MTQASRPNILFIMTDQQAATALSATGNPHLRTPNIDRIAKMGTRFECAYTANPLCVPARASLFTGLTPHEAGIMINVNHGDVDHFDHPMMGTLLTEQGYDTGYVGKWHIPTDPAGTHHGFRYIKHAVANGIDPHVAPASIDYLLNKRDTTKPFLLVSSFVNPHDICEWARGDVLPNGGIPEVPEPDQCPPLPANFERQQDAPQVTEKIKELFPSMFPTAEWDAGKWRQYLFAYYRLVEKVDTEIGKILDALKQSGQWDQTVIIFTSDHGEGMAAHHMNQKEMLYDESARVPFIIAQEGKTPTGQISHALINSCLDVIPTMLDYAEADQPLESLKGFSARGFAEGRTTEKWRDHVVTETHFCKFNEWLGYSGRMLRTQQYKYCVFNAGDNPESLVDMTHDPGEMLNLVNDPSMSSVLEHHRALLKQWRENTNDHSMEVR